MLFEFLKSKAGIVTFATPDIAKASKAIAGAKITNKDNNYQKVFGYNPWTKEVSPGTTPKEAQAAHAAIMAAFAADRAARVAAKKKEAH